MTRLYKDYFFSIYFRHLEIIGVTVYYKGLSRSIILATNKFYCWPKLTNRKNRYPNADFLFPFKLYLN